MNYPIKIVGCVVDVHNLTMYKADGDTIVIPQGDPRVKDLVAVLVPALDSKKPLAERFYMLTGDDLADKNHFSAAEKQMNGVVRFFKMAKAKAKELLDKFVAPVEPMKLGFERDVVKQPPTPVHSLNGVDQGPVVEDMPELPPENERPLTKSEAAVAEIMAHARPSSDAAFSVPDAQGAEETTVLAVLADNTIIPGCEALVGQAQAVSEGISSGTGMENFMRRAGMIRRGHSVEDLLKFIQKGELPIADDGSVLVYKLLNRTEVEGVFVDCHSGRVKQRVGSHVHMAEELVDPDRRQDCSNGLHVARRDYLQHFGGNVCVLAKLAPEDVIAVPQYDARKLRAKGYTIIAELSDEDRRLVCSNKPMQDQVLLGNAVKGNHAEIIEYVEITQSTGGGLVVTKVEGAVGGMPVLDQSLQATSLDHLPTEEFSVERNSVDARELALKVSATPVHLHEDLPAVPLTETVGMSRRLVPEPVETVSESPATPVTKPVKVQQARPVDLLVQAIEAGNYTVTDCLALLAFKKQAKKSWTALGVKIAVWEKATKVVDSAVTKAEEILLPKVTPAPALAKPAKVKKAPAPLKAPAKPKADPKPKAAKPVATTRDTFATKGSPLPEGKKTKMTQQESMAKLVEIYNRNPDKQNAKEIVAFKQKAKKSWDVLGVTDAKFIKKITERAKL